uniref:Uncharacterized protein n=1 Tax=Anguilla anguilla TaxID=7936 RepID=A0A0E9XC53_ANGAN
MVHFVSHSLQLHTAISSYQRHILKFFFP